MKKLWIFLLGIVPLGAIAQQVKGIVLNEKKIVLPSASISVGNGLVVQTDLSGVFSLLLKDTGKVELSVSYLGYQTQTVAVNVAKGENNIGNILLVPSTNSLGEIIVRGSSALSQIKSLAIKKNAGGIVDVLSSDAIGKLPDRNAAEAIQRIPGVSIARDAGEGRYVTVRGVPTQWTASLLNGNHIASASIDYMDRRVQMDILPSSLIEFVELSKAITPDIEGDNIGGSVNFISRTSPSKRTLIINGAGGYSPLPQKAGYNFSLVYGDRLFKNKFGYMLSASTWDRHNRTNRYNMNYNFSNPDPVASFSIQDFQLRDYDVHRKTNGYSASMDYTFDDNNKIYFKGFASQFNDMQDVREEYFNYNSSYVQMQTRSTNNRTRLASGEIGGTHKLANRLALDWNASMDKSSAMSKNPLTGENGYPFVVFRQNMKFNGLSSDGRMYLKMDSQDGKGSSIDHFAPNNATPLNADSMLLSQVLNIRTYNYETNKRIAFNLNYTVNERFKIKLGGKYQHKDKTVQNSPLDVYVAGILGKAPALSSFNTQPYPFAGGFLRNLDNNYNSLLLNPMYMKDVAAMTSSAQIAANKLYKLESDSANNASGASKYYSGTENYYAGYLMGTYNVSSNFTIIGGFRNEYNNASYNSSLVSTDSLKHTNISRIKQPYDYNSFLPMLHLKYMLDGNKIFRLSYTKTYIRPDFGSLNPATVTSVITSPPTISSGNPDLKPTYSNNFDFMFEDYLPGAGLLSAGAFYKGLKNFIYTNSGLETVNGTNYITTQPRNLPNAWLYGFEVDYSKRFLELPGILKNTGVSLNYTFVNSQTKIPRLLSNNTYVYDATTLPQQSKHLFNATLYYEGPKLMVRIAGNYKGPSVFTINSAYGTDHYVWAAKYFVMDFSSSYKLSKHFRASLQLNNLLNTPSRYYMGTYNRVYQAEWYGIQGEVGISYTL